MSPGSVTAFKNCALAFKFTTIDRLSPPPSIAAVRDLLLHQTLDRLLGLASEERTPARADRLMSEIRSELESNPIYLELELDAECAQSLAVAAGRLLSNYFVLENPQLVHPIGLKLGLKAKVGDALLDGTIDRLDLDQNGGLTVTIYKTGRTPPPNYEQARLGDVQFYAFLCERLLGRLPARVQLLYLGEPAAIVTEPTAKTLRSAASQLGAVWQAVNRACERHDFRPHQSKLCEWCDFKSRCPEFGGDPHAG